MTMEMQEPKVSSRVPCYTVRLLVVVILQAMAVSALAMPPGLDGTLPPGFFDRVAEDPAAFTYKRSLVQVTERAMVARKLASLPLLGDEVVAKARQQQLAQELGVASVEGMLTAKVRGLRRIPVILVTFKDTRANPYPARNLQQELFNGPWPTGTMTEYYREVSNGVLEVTGTVHDWKSLSKAGAYYAGADYFDPRTGKNEHCNGMCRSSKVGDLIREALDSNAAVDWSQLDNDGPDGIPNSGDDDGYVDFVAFVHPGTGGECGQDNANIWSHRYSLSALTGNEYLTKSGKKGGGFIKIDDYVIMPALACDGTTMIQIGVFAHEFGHAFGLPDLYDTDRANGASAGIGNWCLMAGGSWGGDGHSPEKPVHMSAWAKWFLGWIELEPVDKDMQDTPIDHIRASKRAWQLSISQNQFYLINGVQKGGFDEKLPGEGLQIWKINQSVIDRTLPNNRVNADHTNRGVELVEADGTRGLDKSDFRGGPGDLFPGTSNNRRFDNRSLPQSVGVAAVCDISDPAPLMRASLQISSGVCSVLQSEDVARNWGLAGGGERIGEALPKQKVTSISSVSELDKLPDNALVSIWGRLENLGKSLFDAKSRRIVLKDQDGRVVDVRVPIPVETMQGPIESGREGPAESLGSLLDKELKITGRLIRETKDSIKTTRILVESIQREEK